MADVPMTRRQQREQAEGLSRTRRHAGRERERAARPPESPVVRGARIVLGLLILAAVPLMLLRLDTVQLFESNVAAFAIRLMLGVDAQVAGTVITVGLGSAHVFAMQVTAACSVVPLMVPLLLVAVAMLVSGRGSLLRTVPAVVVACSVLLAVNAVRFVLISWMTRTSGLEGFGWAHTFWGSLVALVGLTAVTFAYVAAVSRSRRSSRCSA